MKKILTCRELLEELQELEENELDSPVEIAAYIYPSDILKKIEGIRQRQKEDIRGIGSECGIYCFQEEHVGTSWEMTASNIRKQTGKENCFAIAGEISLEKLPEGDEVK